MQIIVIKKLPVQLAVYGSLFIAETESRINQYIRKFLFQGNEATTNHTIDKIIIQIPLI
jgi:hypothetical protein